MTADKLSARISKSLQTLTLNSRSYEQSLCNRHHLSVDDTFNMTSQQALPVTTADSEAYAYLCRICPPLFPAPILTITSGLVHQFDPTTRVCVSRTDSIPSRFCAALVIWTSKPSEIAFGPFDGATRAEAVQKVVSSLETMIERFVVQHGKKHRGDSARYGGDRTSAQVGD
jgi:hypothetical protein